MRIKELAKEAGWSESGLACSLRTPKGEPMSRGNLSKILNGHQPITEDYAKQIAALALREGIAIRWQYLFGADNLRTDADRNSMIIRNKEAIEAAALALAYWGVKCSAFDGIADDEPKPTINLPDQDRAILANLIIDYALQIGRTYEKHRRESAFWLMLDGMTAEE